MGSKYPVKKFIFCSLSIKRFHPYFELLYFRRGKAVWSSKISNLQVNLKSPPQEITDTLYWFCGNTYYFLFIYLAIYLRVDCNSANIFRWIKHKNYVAIPSPTTKDLKSPYPTSPLFFSIVSDSLDFHPQTRLWDVTNTHLRWPAYTQYLLVDIFPSLSQNFWSKGPPPEKRELQIVGKL